MVDVTTGLLSTPDERYYREEMITTDVKETFRDMSDVRRAPVFLVDSLKVRKVSWMCRT